MVDAKKTKKDFTQNYLLSKNCVCWRPGVIAVTPDIIDQLDDTCVLVDIYGQRKTKAQFLKERKGQLYYSKKAGVTIYALDYNE